MSKFDNQIPIRNVFTVILDSKKISTTASIASATYRR
jgi:hypothetical protein